MIDLIDRALEALGRSCANVTVFLLEHNPLTVEGRRQLHHTILHSGPPYNLPSSHHQKGAHTAKFSGWRTGALLTIALLTFSLVIEVIMLAIASQIDASASETDGGVSF